MPWNDEIQSLPHCPSHTLHPLEVEQEPREDRRWSSRLSISTINLLHILSTHRRTGISTAAIILRRQFMWLTSSITWCHSRRIIITSSSRFTRRFQAELITCQTAATQKCPRLSVLIHSREARPSGTSSTRAQRHRWKMTSMEIPTNPVRNHLHNTLLGFYVVLNLDGISFLLNLLAVLHAFVVLSNFADLYQPF